MRWRRRRLSQAGSRARAPLCLLSLHRRTVRSSGHRSSSAPMIPHGKGEAAVSGRRASSSAIRVDYAVIIRAAATLRNKAGVWFAEEFPRGSRKRSPQGGNRLSLRPTISAAYCCGFGGAPSMRLSRVGSSNSILLIGAFLASTFAFPHYGIFLLPPAVSIADPSLATRHAARGHR